jgi:hypothetical protein
MLAWQSTQGARARVYFPNSREQKVVACLARERDPDPACTSAAVVSGWQGRDGVDARDLDASIRLASV